MSTEPDGHPHHARRQIPAWFERVSKLSWGFLGMVAAVGAIVFGLAALRELVIPLVLAAFFAAVVSPGVDWLAQRRVPRLSLIHISEPTRPAPLSRMPSSA